MAPKKKPNPKRRTRTPSKKRRAQSQLSTILISLVVLMAVVVLAAVLARIFLPLPHSVQPTAAPKVKHHPVPVAKPEVPTYEVFPKQPATPLKPLKNITPLPGYKAPLVAIIIDDIGYDRPIANELMALDIPLTLSMLPYAPHLSSIRTAAAEKGLEIMLHLPMEPKEFPSIDPGPGALLESMTPDEMIAQLDEDLAQIPGIAGVNNHMGSELSTSPERMRQIFSILKKRNLFYIDSRTTAKTKARSAAQLLQLPFTERDIFIDHQDDPQFIENQLDRLIKRAQKQGYAVGIAHPHEATVQGLKAFLPRLASEVTVVPASVIVNSVMIAEAEKMQAARQRSLPSTAQ